MSSLTTPSKSQMLLFQAWRATALQIMPYMASTLFALRPVNTVEVDTFAVDDGLRVYINFDKCEGMGPQFCAEGLLHECSHILAEHSMLAETAGVTDEERKMWNIAGDMAINDDLRDQNTAPAVLAAGESTRRRSRTSTQNRGTGITRTPESVFV